MPISTVTSKNKLWIKVGQPAAGLLGGQPSAASSELTISIDAHLGFSLHLAYPQNKLPEVQRD